MQGWGLADISALTSTQVAGLNTTLTTLTTTQIGELTTTAEQALSTNQLQTMASGLPANYYALAIGSLSTTQVAALTSNLGGALTATQIGQFTTTQAGYLPAVAIDQKIPRSSTDSASISTRFNRSRTASPPIFAMNFLGSSSSKS